MKNYLKVLTIVAIGIVACFNAYLGIQIQPFSSTKLANVESLAADEDENDGFKCVLFKDDCSFTISTYAQLEILRGKGYASASTEVGNKINFSDATQTYALYKDLPWFIRWAYVPIRCKEDITCNDFLKQLGLIS
jgi:hypothetical protein